jgi:hypothetical protein
MKKNILVIITVTIFGFLAMQVNAQKNESDLSALLSKYYGIKNALVKSDAVDAAKQAMEFSANVGKIDVKKLDVSEQQAFNNTKSRLLSDAGIIGTSTDLKNQREVFASFSAAMIILIKTAKLSQQPVYIDYCPMKKNYWLSADIQIKNPYYGNSMLTCGKVSETLQ